MSSSAPKLCVDDISMTFKTPTGVFNALAPVTRRQARRHPDRGAQLAVPAAVRAGPAVIGNSTEPMITQGIRQNIWSEPFFNVPKELGPYAYSTINVRLDSIQKEPEVVRGFVKGMVKGLKFLYANPNEAAEIAKKQFPTMALEDLKATLDRSFKDEMWSKDGMISKQAWATGSAVVREANILKTDVKYEEIIDMSFVESVRARL